MVCVAFSPAAERDLEDIGDYIHAENPPAALRFLNSVRERCQRLGDQPRSGRQRSELWPGTRSVPFGRYVIFYMIDGDELRIERILHGARDIDAIFEEPGAN